MANENKGKKGGNKSKSPYHEAADLLNKVLENSKNQSLKSFVYSKGGSLKVSTRTYAVVTKVLQHLTELQACQAAVEDHLQVKNHGLLLVLLYELLLSPKQSIQGGGALKRQLLRHETSLRRALKMSAQKTATDANGRDRPANSFPRYLRVNMCRTTTKKVIQYLKKELQISSVYADAHVPDLLVVPHAATSQILASDLAKQHHVILQDKSSCFPALCLLYDDAKTAADGDVLDACAAPGNKTSHLAALLMSKQQRAEDAKKKRTIYALDRDKDRCKLLKERMQQLVPSDEDASSIALNLQVEHKDFLKTQPEDYASVTSILLDPSCSGSGIYTRQQQQEKADDENRLQKLSNFQFTCLKHAMSFENVKRIVYSTCSIHSQENEAVVAACLSNDENKKGDWEIVAPASLATWKRRGVEYVAADNGVRALTKDETSKLIRVNHEDDTNGFFVCCLQRKASAQKKKKKFRNPNLDLGIPVFSGEFANDSQAYSSSQPGETVPNNVESDSVDNKKSSKVSESQTQKKRKQRADDEDDKDNKDEEQSAPMNRKRAKKMEWKRRQREQKLSRLAKSGVSK